MLTFGCISLGSPFTVSCAYIFIFSHIFAVTCLQLLTFCIHNVFNITMSVHFYWECIAIVIMVFMMTVVQTRPVFPPCQHVGRLEVLAGDDEAHYLASAVAEDRGFGSSRCPWTIVAPRGRRLNVTLLDFAIVSRHPDHIDGDVCHVYARIRQLPPSPPRRTGTGNEVSRGTSGHPGEVTVCSGRVRERPVFVSDTERVEVTILTESRTNSEDPAYFLLRYSGQIAILTAYLLRANFYTSSL